MQEMSTRKKEMVMKGPVVGDDGEGGDTNKVYTMIATDRSSMESPSRRRSSSPKDTFTIKQEDQLVSTKAEMGEVREENERLKTILARIVKDHQSLQMQFFDILRQEKATKLDVETPSIPHDVEEHELVSLSLGTSVNGQKKENTNTIKEDDKMEEGLELGPDCKYERSSGGPNEPPSNLSPENSFKEPKEEEGGEPWPPSKVLKNLRRGDDEVSQQTHAKKARVSVRARCDAPTMNDGCQWRKYGQKISKGNPCPRAYYRCTVAPSCPVRKQVQRCAEDLSILITTYEGTHNHPLPISATAMASTTSAAACMLMSGPSISRPAIGSPSSSSTTAANITATNPDPQTMNFGLSDIMRARQYYLPNPRITSSPSHPTITLDLTAPPSSSSQSSQFNRFTSNPWYPPKSFSFSSSESNTVPTSWSNGHLSYGTQPFNKSHIGPSNQDPDLHQSYLQKATKQAPADPTQHPLTDTIAKAITSDPRFQSALATAITSYVRAQGGGEGLGHSLKWGEQHFNSAAPTSNGCASSYLTGTTSSGSNPQQGKLVFLEPPLPFTSSKSASASPVDNRENIN